jgi:hypothetical protein
MFRAFQTALLSLALFAALVSSAAANPNYRSTITKITPPQPGLELEVLGFDQNLLLINKTGKTVLVRGYELEPYARILADGTVQENVNSPATYLNSDRYGTATVPPGAGADEPPKWKTLNRTGRLIWHDHRMHWMGSDSGAPPMVKDPSKQAKVFDYEVPLNVGGAPVKVAGTLVWVGEQGGGAPVGAIVAFVLVLLVALAVVVIVRRRRRFAERGDEGESW